MNLRSSSLPAVLLAGAASLLFVAGAYVAVKRAYAEQLAAGSTLAEIDRAIRLEPGNAGYWLRRADLLEAGMRSGEASIERAIELNPSDAAAWIRLGLNAESAGDFARAEHCLLHAASLSALYQPRWTLANFYFRRGMAPQFWKWTQEALALAPRDMRALFRLCWEVSRDPEEIFRRAIPEDRRAWREYLAFLLARDRLDAARTVGTRLLRAPVADDREVLVAACDRFLEAQDGPPALDIWNSLCEAGLLGCEAIDPAGCNELSGGSLEPRGHGFGWRTNTVPGFAVRMGKSELAAYFSGTQPESADLLWKWVPVVPGTDYVLSFEYRTEGIGRQGGLRWVLGGASSAELSSAAWKRETILVGAAAGTGLIRLRLNYVRAAGETRIEGALLTRAMRMERAP